MADHDNDPNIGLPDKRYTKGQSGTNFSNLANLATVAQLRARLTAINAAHYTPARLNAMTKTDMQYAVRRADEAAGM